MSKHACARAAGISASSCGSHLQLDIKIFRLRRCGHAPEARSFLGTRYAEKNGRVDDLYKVYEVEEPKSGTIVVSKVHGVNMGVKCANIGKNGAIMRRFT